MNGHAMKQNTGQGGSASETNGHAKVKEQDSDQLTYRGAPNGVQNIVVKKDPGRARQNSVATAGTNFTKPGAQNKGDLCT